eukprot:7160799-Pyramimonas_sp.AAC.2
MRPTNRTLISSKGFNDDKGPSVRSEGATHHFAYVVSEKTEAGPVASAQHTRCVVIRPSDHTACVRSTGD